MMRTEEWTPSYTSTRSNDRWVNSGRHLYTYDAGGSQTTLVYEMWTDSLWVNYDRDVFSYDAAGNWVGTLVQQWSDDQWVNIWRTTHTYDVRGYETGYVSERWLDNGWENANRQTFSFNEDGNLMFAAYEIWVNSAWVPGNGMWLLADSAGNEYRYEPASSITLHYTVLTVKQETNLVQNPGFESGREPWQFYTSGSGHFSDDAAWSGKRSCGQSEHRLSRHKYPTLPGGDPA